MFQKQKTPFFVNILKPLIKGIDRGQTNVAYVIRKKYFIPD